jgi:type VI secretion system VasD/TssJ family lipoprotein
VVALASSSACKASAELCTPVEPDAEVALLIEAGPGTNPGKSGRALPVRVYVYQLRSLDRLRQASYTQLYDGEDAALGEDLLAVEQLTVYPSTRTNLRVTREPDARYLVSVAFVRAPHGSSWRAVTGLSAPEAAPRCQEDHSEPELYHVRLRASRVTLGVTTRASADTQTDERHDARAPGLPSGAAVPKTPSAPNQFEAPKAPSAPTAPKAPKGPAL